MIVATARLLAVPPEIRDRPVPNFLVSSGRCTNRYVQDDEEENGNYDQGEQIRVKRLQSIILSGKTG